ncbi:hypothetical protein DACRYDRAFT_100756 [Dacryopinax primogenitus]|uniref:Helicase C-terminal domain-containing protein n=1 Tax=Dacryopinax primogenitus (strain DJM 731) TaxID=1858805 RepID=M5G4G2_DACPD|nr:uncharacterized protein DACRYDRAFT_100756 [Dacryopinax primogenitus]EJU00702.1 hypothetical protein DACRYDRAFT_100756 [Dacryopinax primogenitus]
MTPDSCQPPTESFAAGVIILSPQSLPADVPYDHWLSLPEPLLDFVFAALEEQDVLNSIFDLCLAGFARASIRGRRIETPIGIVSRLYIRLYLFPVSLEQSKNLLHHYHLLDMRERPRKLKPAVAISLALSWTSRDAMAWQCLGSGHYAKETLFFEQHSDNRSLSEVFQDLPSPVLPSPRPFKNESDRLLCEAMTWSAPPGMRSILFPYQRRTVWKLLQQELQPGTWADPRYVRIESLDDERPWYISADTCEVRSDTDVTYDRVKGGILCEEMGSGKTCMCIALCLATKGRMASPPNTPQASRVLTKDSMTWPGGEENLPYHNLDSGRDPSENEVIPNITFPSLRQIAQFVSYTSSPHSEHTIARMHTWAEARHVEHLKQVTCRFEEEREEVEQKKPGSTLPFYLETESEGKRRATREASKTLRPAIRIYLSSLTLILVPSMIFQQWNAEILKHCSDGALRVLSVPSRPVQDLSPAETLAFQYDVILMTHERFSAEGTPTSGRRSPLLDIRLQRLIIDEGHVANAENSRLKDFGLRLNVESRWIVTGTPTKNIKGLKMGSHRKKKKNEVPNGVDVVNSRLELLLSDSASNRPLSAWSRAHDGDDLKKLGNMFGFLMVPPFVGLDAAWGHVVSRPLLNPQGPEFGAMQRLLRCLEGVMVRHRAEDIEKDVPLPDLTQEMVVLDMTEHCAMTHNALLAQIAINAIDSERKDQDYLFHPKNRGSLGLVIENLSQSLFWHTDNETDYNERVRTAVKSLATAHTRGAPAEDIELIERSIGYLSRARDNEEWCSVMERMWVPFAVSDLPVEMRTWVRSTPLIRPDGICLIEPERISHIRGFAGLDQRKIVENNLNELAGLGSVYNIFDTELWNYVENMKEFRQGRQKNKSHTSSSSTSRDDDGMAVMAVQTASPSTVNGSPSTPKKKGRGKKEPPAPVLIDPRFESFRTSYPREIYNAAFPLGAPMTETTIGPSLSNKVNYILSDVLKCCTQEKVVIFSSSSLSLSHLAEAFELYRIRFLHFSNTLSVKDRENTIKTFETSDIYRVLLMELKHGARGLNLVSASRVYFCEPVWRADEESQAIKRCHRIGQTRPVTVKTLVTRGTAEEEAIRIRNAHHEQTRQMQDDRSIKHFIEYPQFVTGRTQEWPLLNTSLLRVQTDEEDGTILQHTSSPLQVSPERAKKRVRTEEDQAQARDNIELDIVPSRKPKKGRFHMTSPPSDGDIPLPATPNVRFVERSLPTPPESPYSTSPASRRAFLAEGDVDPVPPAALRSPLRLKIKVSRTRLPSTSAAIAAAAIPVPPPTGLSNSTGSSQSASPPVTPADRLAESSVPLKSAMKQPGMEGSEYVERSPKGTRFDLPGIVTLEEIDIEDDQLMED